MADRMAAHLAGSDLPLGSDTWRWLLHSGDQDVLAGLAGREALSQQRLDELIAVLLDGPRSDAWRRGLLAQVVHRGCSQQAALDVAARYAACDGSMLRQLSEHLGMPVEVVALLADGGQEGSAPWRLLCQKAASGSLEQPEVATRWVAAVDGELLWRTNLHDRRARRTDPVRWAGRAVMALLGMTGADGWRTRVASGDLEELLEVVDRLVGSHHQVSHRDGQQGAQQGVEALVGALADAWMLELDDEEVLEDLPGHQQVLQLAAAACAPSVSFALEQRRMAARAGFQVVLQAMETADAGLAEKAVAVLDDQSNSRFVRDLRIRLLCDPRVVLPASPAQHHVGVVWPGMAEALCQRLRTSTPGSETYQQVVGMVANRCLANRRLLDDLLGDATGGGLGDERHTVAQAADELVDVACALLVDLLDRGEHTSARARIAAAYVVERGQTGRLPAGVLRIDTRPRRRHHEATANRQVLAWAAERLADDQQAWVTCAALVEDGTTATLDELVAMSLRLSQGSGETG